MPSDTSLTEAGVAVAPAAVGGAGSASSNAIAKLLPLDEGFYALTIVGNAGWAGVAPGFAVPAVHISAAPNRGGAIEITDVFGRPAAWLGGRHSTVLVKSPAGGGHALVTAYPARDAEHPPLKLEIRRLDAIGFAAAAMAERPDENIAVVRQPPFATLFLADSIATPEGPEEVRVEVVVHLRGRGDIRFVDALWAGHLGPGLWIESFTILPRHRLAAAAIEYKGLTATGVETAWLGSGTPCGTRGANTPLIGFAVRQKATPGEALFDCEYTGCFQSGAVVGPCRNGAPCLSAAANDPLEGMQLRIIARRKPPKAAVSEPKPSKKAH
jgi:hypothetical protein